jgi:cytochrome P450
MQYPLQVILAILGLPESDYPRMLKLTQELFGSSDPELTRGQSLEDLVQVINDFFVYFTALTEERKATPTEDLASVIANAKLDGAPIGIMEQISYYVIVATAGHDTTASAMAGGMQALIEHPDQLDELRAAAGCTTDDDRALVAAAMEEILRWSTVTMHFRRTAMDDVELGARQIRAGDKVVMWFVSADRDEAQFPDAATFDIHRRPNDHVAFGRMSPHLCLGSHLARLELHVLFSELLPRLADVRIAGPIERLRSNFIAGIKRLPIEISRA